MTTTQTKHHTGVLCTVHGGIRVVDIDFDDYCASIARQIGSNSGVEPVAPGTLDGLTLWVGAESLFTDEPNIGTSMFARTLGLPRGMWLHGDVLITGGASYETGESLDLTADQLQSLVGPDSGAFRR